MRQKPVQDSRLKNMSASILMTTKDVVTTRYDKIWKACSCNVSYEVLGKSIRQIVKSKYLHKRITSFLSANFENFDINVFLSTVITPNILSMPSETNIRKNNTEKNGDPGKWITESENAIKARPDPIWLYKWK